jgi:tetratricopeptide (TPR) repeat protein
MKWAAAVLVPAALVLVSSNADQPRRRESPGDLAAAAASFMDRARVTGDAAWYARAEAACDRALALAPGHYDALRLRAWVYGGQHRFDEAATAARRAMALRPSDPFNYGTLGDALVEVGDYDGAAVAFQTMLDLRPDSASYARGAYLRELTGDTDGAIELMVMATAAAGPGQQAWYRSQLGDLYFSKGDARTAARLHDEALVLAPVSHAAMAGAARANAALGNAEKAIALYRRSLDLLPSPVVAEELGDLLRTLERHDDARTQYALVDAMAQLDGAMFDRQIAVAHADRGVMLREALEVAERSLRSRKDIYGYDAVAWCALKAGDVTKSQHAMAEAMKLGTKDAKLYYHAGMIALAASNASEAKRLVAEALRINPSFDYRGSVEARRILRRLS